MKAQLDNLLNVPVSDPDDARRRRLINILLLGTIVAAMLGLLAIIVTTALSQQYNPGDLQTLLLGITTITIGILGIYQINRRYSGRLAALLFLLLLTAIFSFSDSPEQLSNGRSLFIFTIPI